MSGYYRPHLPRITQPIAVISDEGGASPRSTTFRQQAERDLDGEKTLEPAALAKFYQYRRIDHKYGSRLFVLSPGNQSAKLLGHLRPFSVGETRGYKALLYVWGKPRFTDTIFVKGKRLAITDSLGATLRQLRPLPSQPPLYI